MRQLCHMRAPNCGRASVHACTCMQPSPPSTESLTTGEAGGTAAEQPGRRQNAHESCAMCWLPAPHVCITCAGGPALLPCVKPSLQLVNRPVQHARKRAVPAMGLSGSADIPPPKFALLCARPGFVCACPTSLLLLPLPLTPRRCTACAWLPACLRKRACLGCAGVQPPASSQRCTPPSAMPCSLWLPNSSWRVMRRQGGERRGSAWAAAGMSCPASAQSLTAPTQQCTATMVQHRRSQTSLGACTPRA